MNNFSKKIKELRGKESLRQAAKNIGISHTYLDSLEKGYDPRSGKERKPTIEVINKISKYYSYDFFELANLADVFVSIKDAPQEIKMQEFEKFKYRMKEKYMNDRTKVRENYINLLSDELPYDKNLLLNNVYNFLMNEEENKYLMLREGEETNSIIFMATLFQIMVREKNSQNKEMYDDIINDFSDFLKEYLNIK